MLSKTSRILWFDAGLHLETFHAGRNPLRRTTGRFHRVFCNSSSEPGTERAGSSARPRAACQGGFPRPRSVFAAPGLRPALGSACELTYGVPRPRRPWKLHRYLKWFLKEMILASHLLHNWGAVVTVGLPGQRWGRGGRGPRGRLNFQASGCCLDDCQAFWGSLKGGVISVFLWAYPVSAFSSPCLKWPPKSITTF